MSRGNDSPKLCWACGAELEVSHKFCKNCGKPVKVHEAPANQPISPTHKAHDPPLNTVPNSRTTSIQNRNGNSPPKYCYICGAQLEESNKFCKNCGKPVRFYENSANQPIAQPIAPTTSIQNENGNRSSMQYPSQLKNQNSTINPPVIQRIDQLEKKINEIDIKKRFETIDYKLNALFGEVHFDQNFKDLEKKINEQSSKEEISHLTEKIKNRLKDLEKKMDELATADDILHLHGKIDALNLERFDSILNTIENRVANLKPDEKVMNLAKNTVIRLNTLEEIISNFNIEDRKRLIKIDERLNSFENKVESMNKILATLVPSLVKLTEKVNQLQTTVNSNFFKIKSNPPLEKFPVLSQPSTNLAPFPGPKIKSQAQKSNAQELPPSKKEEIKSGKPSQESTDDKKESNKDKKKILTI